MKNLLTFTFIVLALSACKEPIKVEKIGIPYKVVATQKLDCKDCSNNFVYVDIKGLDENSAFKEVKKIGGNLCKLSSPYCTVFYWTDETKVGSRLPMTDQQADSISFNYSVNSTTGLNKFKCFLFDPNNFKCPNT